MLMNPAQIPEIAKAAYMDVKVVDFGTLKIVNATSNFSLETMTGTRAWMAPEVMFEAEEDSSKMKY
jgi:serine/threonine protein kinase